MKLFLMSFSYTKCIELDGSIEYIQTIIFAISRFSKYKISIRFDKLYTEKEAVEKVEEWLSNKVSKDYYNIVSDDLFHDNLSDYGEKPTRGRLLGDCKYLEVIKKIDGGTIEIFCGS